MEPSYVQTITDTTAIAHQVSSADSQSSTPYCQLLLTFPKSFVTAKEKAGILRIFL